MITVSKKCPKCGSQKYFRVRRKNWMRMAPFTKYYTCSDCHYGFLFVFGFFGF